MQDEGGINNQVIRPISLEKSEKFQDKEFSKQITINICAGSVNSIDNPSSGIQVIFFSTLV